MRVTLALNLAFGVVGSSYARIFDDDFSVAKRMLDQETAAKVSDFGDVVAPYHPIKNCGKPTRGLG